MQSNPTHPRSFLARTARIGLASGVAAAVLSVSWPLTPQFIRQGPGSRSAGDILLGTLRQSGSAIRIVQETVRARATKLFMTETALAEVPSAEVLRLAALPPAGVGTTGRMSNGVRAKAPVGADEPPPIGSIQAEHAVSHVELTAQPEPPAPTPLVTAAAADVPFPTLAAIESRRESEEASLSRGPARPQAEQADAPPPTTPTNDPQEQVRGVLMRYADAFNRLDPVAVSDVVPSINQRKLARAFESLRSQQVSFGKCDVEVNGSSARADCTGRTSWIPRVGAGPHTQYTSWTFLLENGPNGWRIVQAATKPSS
jgi:hypothetical protein